jgi:murein L,D-transpeptidase YcbB/YkuD
MKVVAGKLSTRSPRFSTWCWQVVLYPYWNVPEDIGLRELLPHFKKNSAYGESSNMQVLNKNGKVINPHSINWSQYNRSNFPYSFRQCTGCENSLGVIKFNLTDPFDVYLHDTNFKLAFLKDTRFLSHGCIRVEKPIELANYLLDNQVDSNFLKACYKGLQPIPVNLKEKVPVFVVYMPAEVVGDSVKIYKDIYRLFTSSKR